MLEKIIAYPYLTFTAGVLILIFGWYVEPIITSQWNKFRVEWLR
jgi:hypothetical protein